MTWRVQDSNPWDFCAREGSLMSAAEIIKTTLIDHQIEQLRIRIAELRSEPIPDTDAINNLRETIKSFESLQREKSKG